MEMIIAHLEIDTHKKKVVRVLRYLVGVKLFRGLIRPNVSFKTLILSGTCTFLILKIYNLKCNDIKLLIVD